MKQSHKNEMLVGVFVIVALVVLFGMTFIIRGSTGMNPYTVKTVFPNVAGLELGSPVLVQGFRLGRVVEMEPEIGEDGVPNVVVISTVARTIPIYKNATVNLVQQGFIGDKRLEIDPGTEDAGPIESGDFIDGIPPRDMAEVFGEAGEMIDDLKATLKNIRDLTSDENRIAEIDATLRNVRQSSEEMNAILQENREAIREITSNMQEISEKTTQTVQRIDEIVEKADDEFVAISEEVRGALKDIRTNADNLNVRINAMLDESEGVGENANELLITSKEEVKALSERLKEVSDNLNKILEGVNAGEGTAGRLVKDEGLFEDLSDSIAALRHVFADENRGFYDSEVEYRLPETKGGEEPVATEKTEANAGP